MGISGARTNHKKGINVAEKQRRREEAIARQAEYDGLTTKEKIARLEGRGIKKGREYDRLIEKLATNT